MFKTLRSPSTFILIGLQTAIFASYFIYSHLLFIFSSVLSLHTTTRGPFYHAVASLTTSIHQYEFLLLLLPLFFSYTSSHSPGTPALKHPHKFGTPVTTSPINYLSKLFLMLPSFDKPNPLPDNASFTQLSLFLLCISHHWPKYPSVMIIHKN